MGFRIINTMQGFEILEIHRGDVFEYYVKVYNKSDYIFAFGVADRFTEHQLRILAEKGYFDTFEEV